MKSSKREMRSSAAWLEMAMWKLWLWHKKILNKYHYLLLCAFCVSLFSLPIISIGVSKKKNLNMGCNTDTSFSEFWFEYFSCLFCIFDACCLLSGGCCGGRILLSENGWCRLMQPEGGAFSWRKSVNVTESIFFFYILPPSSSLKLMQAACGAWNETRSGADLLSLNHFNTKEKDRL